MCVAQWIYNYILGWGWRGMKLGRPKCCGGVLKLTFIVVFLCSFGCCPPLTLPPLCLWLTRKVCDEWLTRTRPTMLALASTCGSLSDTITHGIARLHSLSNVVIFI